MAYTIFTINETAWVFSPQKFNSLLEKKKIKGSNKNGRRISNAKIYNELSELIHISPDAIKKWKLGKNSFSDENYLRLLAQYFDVDKTDLLVPVTNNENKSVIPDNSDVDRAEVNRVFTECLNILFQITHFQPEEGKGTRKQQKIENTQNTVNNLRSLNQSVYAHSLLISPHITNKLHHLLMDIEQIAEGRLCNNNPWKDMPDYVNNYECEVYAFQFFLFDSKKDICEDSPSINGVCYICDEIEYADDLGLGNTVDPDDNFEEHCDDAEVVMKYGYQGDYEITPTMVYDHILTKYMAAVFRYTFSDLFEDF